MKNINKAVKDFLFNYIGLYHNPYGVEFSSDCDNENAVYMGVDYPGETFNEYVSVELIFESETTSGFVEAFQVQSVSDIKDITPQQMLDLFYKGKTSIFCLVEDNPNASHLMFRKQNNVLLATDEDDSIHEVPVPLETAQQFIAYTRQYYLMPAPMKVVE